MNKSEEMRRLARQGLAVGDIAQRLGVRYQFAYNVLKGSGLLAPTRSNLLPRAGAFGEGRSDRSTARSPPSADSTAVQEVAWDTFIGVLREYVEERLPLLPQTYNWDIPTYAEMVLDGANDAERSISLRSQLSATWAVADAAERRRIAIFYVTGFGGIRSNAGETLDEYADETAEATIERGLQGIASWSKILAIRDPAKYAIYDARVGLQLNRIQVARLGHLAVGFPMLPSQNREVVASMAKLRPSVATAVLRLRPGEAYKRYLRALTEVAGEHPIEKVEMMLFAAAAGNSGGRHRDVLVATSHQAKDGPEKAPIPTNLANRAVYLVSCVKTKKATAAPARELYISDWFRSARALVETRSAPWFILSAEYGLVEPGSIIEPYENALKHQPIARRRQWAATVAARLIASAPNLTQVVMLAGDAYAEFLAPKLRAAGVEVVRPMLGLRQGQQLSWLKRHR